MDDKKKLIVVVVLAVIILAVGAFQLTSGGSAPAETPKAEKKVADAKTTAIDEGPKNLEVASPLAMRDPFEPGQIAPTLTEPDPAPTKPDPKPSPRPTGVQNPIDLTGIGQLPGANIGIQPVEPPAPKDVFSYSLAGIVLGDRPAALFADGAGNQKLVREGGAIDGDARLVSISRGKVTVTYKGEKISITLGGNSSGN